MHTNEKSVVNGDDTRLADAQIRANHTSTLMQPGTCAQMRNEWIQIDCIANQQKRRNQSVRDGSRNRRLTGMLIYDIGKPYGNHVPLRRS
jgi:hypothetical protein